MKKRFLPVIAGLLLFMTLLTATSAGATSFSVSGTGNPLAYQVLFDQSVGLLTPIPVPKEQRAQPWVTGNWITYNNPDQTWPMDANSGNLPGNYYYMTMFDLTGFNPATAVITGTWASDNGSALYINDISNADNLVSTITGYSTLTSFTINRGFSEGINFLTFVVTNDPWGPDPGINPTGLMVNIDSATAEPVPEPSTIALFAAGLVSAVLIKRRRQN